MATVNGYTKEKMDQIADETVVSGTVVGSDLHLTTRGGDQINAGSVRGDEGPAGPAVARVMRQILLPAIKMLTMGPRLKLTNPDVLPVGLATDISWSPDGRFYAVSHATTPFVSVYSFDGTNSTKLANPATLPAGSGMGVAWSPNGRFLAVAHSASPYLSVYSFDGNALTKLTNPGSLPTDYTMRPSWHPSGDFVSFAIVNGGFVTYRLNQNTGGLTRISDPTPALTAIPYDLAWSPSGRFLAISADTTPFVHIYEFDGVSTYTKLANPGTLPVGSGRGIAWSPNEKYLAIGHITTPFLTVYSFSGTTFTKVANPATLPVNAAFGVSFSPDSQYLVCVTGGVSPYIVTYAFNSGQASPIGLKLADPTAIALANAMNVRWSPDGATVAVAQSGSPFVTLYDTLPKYITDGTSAPAWI